MEQDKPGLVQLLVSRGCSLTTRDSSGRTAVFIAVTEGYKDCGMILAEAMAAELEKGQEEKRDLEEEMEVTEEEEEKKNEKKNDKIEIKKNI